MASYNGLTAALKDIEDGLRLAPLWWRLGIEQTATRYRRTLLGPFWLAGSTIATGFALVIVFGGIMGMNWREAVPFILTGITAWTIVSGVVSDGAQTFMQASGVMQVQKLPLSFHACLQMHRVLINFAHQIVAFWIIMLLMGFFTVPHWQLLLSLPIVVVTGFLLTFPIGMLSTRYRDVANFVTLAMSALFMLTPVFWRRAQVSPEMMWIVDYNPFAYLLEIIRQPFLGHPVGLRYWAVSLLILVVSALLAVISLALFRRRVVYWL